MLVRVARYQLYWFALGGILVRIEHKRVVLDRGLVLVRVETLVRLGEICLLVYHFEQNIVI